MKKFNVFVLGMLCGTVLFAATETPREMVINEMLQYREYRQEQIAKTEKEQTFKELLVKLGFQTND